MIVIVWRFDAIAINNQRAGEKKTNTAHTHIQLNISEIMVIVLFLNRFVVLSLPHDELMALVSCFWGVIML